MAYLPVEPRIGKIIIYGVIFRCLDPLLTIAAGLSYKDPFVTPLNCRQQADQVGNRLFLFNNSISKSHEKALYHSSAALRSLCRRTRGHIKVACCYCFRYG